MRYEHEALGMAFSMFADDYNGTFYYDAENGVHFTDIGNPLEQYLGISPSDYTAMRTIRTCPARVGLGQYTAAKGYENARLVSAPLWYANADMNGSPFYENSNAPYWPNLEVGGPVWSLPAND